MHFLSIHGVDGVRSDDNPKSRFVASKAVQRTQVVVLIPARIRVSTL